jgi:hypothetical protein
LHWDNSGAAEEPPQNLEKLPEWTATEEATSERALRIKKVIEELREEIAKSSPSAALEAFANSDTPKEKRDKGRDEWKKPVDDLLSKGELPAKELTK